MVKVRGGRMPWTFFPDYVPIRYRPRRRRSSLPYQFHKAVDRPDAPVVAHLAPDNGHGEPSDKPVSHVLPVDNLYGKRAPAPASPPGHLPGLGPSVETGGKASFRNADLQLFQDL